MKKMNKLLFAALLGLNFYGFAQSQLINNQFAAFTIESGNGIVDVYIGDIYNLVSLKNKIADTPDSVSGDFDLRDGNGVLITEANFQQWREKFNEMPADETAALGTIVAAIASESDFKVNDSGLPS